jgi:glycine betaine/proline transport system substrate-binding protein
MTRHTALTALAFGLAMFSVGAGAADKIRVGQVNLSFYAVTGGVVQEVLDRSGVSFEVVEGSHGEIYPQLGRGEVDLLAASWLPNAHATLYAGVKDRTFVVAELYQGARLYLAVPAYAPKEVVSVADLARPEAAAQFDKTIVGIGPTSGLMIGAEKMMDRYGLQDAGYRLQPGEARDWVANFIRAYDEKRNIVMPLWRPQWINASYRIRVLDDPQNIYGNGDSAVLLANRALRDKLPADVLRRLQRIRLSIDAVTEMDRLVNVEKLTPRDAARRWIADNSRLTRDWFPKPGEPR